MIRHTKHQGRDYIIIDSSIKLNDVSVPFQMQVNITNVKEENRQQLLRVVSVAFNRVMDFSKPKLQPVKKAWYKFW
jgi:hypothetical protein